MVRYVYQFGGGKADGHGEQSSLLGGKGAGLAEMTSLGIPVPAGFTLTTEVSSYHDGHGEHPEGLKAQVESAIERLNELTSSTFGDASKPLLVSVRSGAAASMPGMMDTVLNLGLNDQTVRGLAEATGDARFAYDCYRRFVAMYGEVVMGVIPEDERADNPFQRILEDKKLAVGVEHDDELSANDLKGLVAEYKIEILKRRQESFPEHPMSQLWGAVGAVLQSWNTPRARYYRRMNNISDAMGTAVNVQSMVFGNLGENSGTGVAFTRNPSTGEPGLYGEFLLNAQGEDVVAGMRTPRPISELENALPEVFEQLSSVAKRLEQHFRDTQDLEFTIQEGKLWLLQTRTGKRTGQAMLRMAVDYVNEGRIDKRQAVMRIDPEKLSEVLHPTLDPDSRPTPVAKGLPASPGAAIGRVVFTAKDAEEWFQRGETVVLVRNETSPEDIHGMKAAVGVLTARGGMTSHAAVVARGMGKPCVTGCSQIRVELAREQFIAGGQVVHKGDTITLDGTTGEVFIGTASLVPAELTDDFYTVMEWVDEVRRLRVRTNADRPEDARTARAFGAEGIGLCRTEHMFFDPDRILAVRRMILAVTSEERRAALAEILPMQRRDFEGIFEAMDGFPVSIRLLDPPLHEFLPHGSAEISEVSRALGVRGDIINRRLAELSETNPMLGHRGCRLGMTAPEIYETQVRAIAEAAVSAVAQGIDVKVEIMVPLVSVAEELRRVRELIVGVMDTVLGEAGIELPYMVGTMIELPRACVVADKIAEYADFFSFGTNDLTQTTYGYSRDDSARFVSEYIESGVLSADPFVTLDREGVGTLVRMAVERGRAVKTKLKIGVCGEHGGDPSSVEFCHVEGFDYVSCSPFRIPVARVAAARAALLGEARGR